MADQIWASYSQLVNHRKCPQAWMYGYERRLEKIDPEDVRVELEFGNWWHMLRAADSLKRGKDSIKHRPRMLKSVDNGPTMPADMADPSGVLGLAENWWGQQTEYTWSVWAERIGEALPDRLEALDQRWRAQWAEELETEIPLAVEMSWGRDLPALRGAFGVVHPNTRLVGYVDEVFKDRRRNAVVVRDHKAHKQLGTMTTADDMMDSQLQFYAWGASPDISAWGLGKVQATAYDRVRMVKPKQPVVTQSGTLSKSVTDYDLATYVEWARGPDGQGVPFPGRSKDGSQAGLYLAEDGVIEKLARPATVSAWFQRTLTPLNSNLIKVHLRAAVDSAADLAQTRARAQVTGEAPRNLTSGCRWCDYVGLCRAEMVGGVSGDYELSDYKLRQRPSH